MRKRKWVTKAAASTLAVCMTVGSAFTGITPMNVQAADDADVQWKQIQDVVGRYYGE